VRRGTLAVVRARLLLLTWIVATVAATGLVWLGVRSVVGGVAAPLPAPALVAESEPVPVAAGTRDASADDPQANIRTFTLTGGTVTVRFSPDEVAVLSAVPTSGFETDVDADDGRTRVEFESDRHQSRLSVWWDGGPRHRIDEDDDADDGDDDADDGDDDADDD
jgi:hypothetical protein